MEQFIQAGCEDSVIEFIQDGFEVDRFLDIREIKGYGIMWDNGIELEN